MAQNGTVRKREWATTVNAPGRSGVVRRMERPNELSIIDALERRGAQADGSVAARVFRLAHEIVHMLDLRLPTADPAAIDHAMMALPLDARLRLEARAIAVALRVLAAAGHPVRLYDDARRIAHDGIRAVKAGGERPTWRGETFRRQIMRDHRSPLGRTYAAMIVAMAAQSAAP